MMCSTVGKRIENRTATQEEGVLQSIINSSFCALSFLTFLWAMQENRESFEWNTDFDDVCSLSTNLSQTTIWDEEESCLFNDSSLDCLACLNQSIHELSTTDLIKSCLYEWKHYAHNRSNLFAQQQYVPKKERKLPSCLYFVDFTARTCKQPATNTDITSLPIDFRPDSISFWEDAAKQLRNVKALINISIQKMLLGHVLETCYLIFAAWRTHTGMAKARFKRLSQSTTISLHNAFREWRVFATRQRDLSESASAIASQVYVSYYIICSGFVALNRMCFDSGVEN
jgi:hypothetical protein